MGSLFSSPKPIPAISAPQVVYAPAPSSPVSGGAGQGANSNGGGDNGSDAGGATNTPAQSTSEARKANLLKRDRGIFGTIQTGARGLLSPSTGQGGAARKNLLGE